MVVDEHALLLVQARRMLREADVNGDGLISKEEFVSLLGETNVADSLDQYDARLRHSVVEIQTLVEQRQREKAK